MCFSNPQRNDNIHMFFLYHNFINFDTDQSWSIIQMFSTFPILIAISIYLNVISLSKSEYTTCLFCSSAHHETSVDAMLTLIFLVSMVNIYISICWLHICMYINNNFILNKAKKNSAYARRYTFMKLESTPHQCHKIYIKIIIY